jgi:hypothetical protein
MKYLVSAPVNKCMLSQVFKTIEQGPDKVMCDDFFPMAVYPLNHSALIPPQLLNANKKHHDRIRPKYDKKKSGFTDHLCHLYQSPGYPCTA